MEHTQTESIPTHVQRGASSACGARRAATWTTELILAFCALAASAAPAHAAADMEDETTEVSETGSEDPEGRGSALLTLQSFWTEGKVVPGLAFGLRFDRLQLDLETSLLWLTEPARPQGKSMLGSGFGAQLMYLPVHERSFDLGVGLGCDVYWLWNVHGDAVEQALALKAAGHIWLTPALGVYVSARAYPWRSAGMDLGTQRDGEAALPVLSTAGLTWKL